MKANHFPNSRIQDSVKVYVMEIRKIKLPRKIIFGHSRK